MPSDKLVELQRATSRQPELVELLHELNQPVTALACALEIGLRKERSCREYRLLLEAALGEARRIAGATRTLSQRLERSGT